MSIWQRIFGGREVPSPPAAEPFCANGRVLHLFKVDGGPCLDCGWERPRPSTRFPPGRSGNPAGRRKGVGNDLLEARHLAAAMYRSLGLTPLADDVEHGRRDDKPEMVALRGAVTRGRVLERRKVGKGE